MAQGVPGAIGGRASPDGVVSMSIQAHHSRPWHRGDDNTGTSKGVWAGLLRITGSAVLLILVGCASQTVITETERSAVNAGDKAVVLLNVQCTIDGQPQEAFVQPTFTREPLFLFGIGTFETVGEPRIAAHRYLSEETRRAGWTYFTLSSGVYYLAVLGPDSSVISIAGSLDSQKYLRDAPRWRIDVPENARLIYVGTLQTAGKSHGELLFGGKIIRPVDSNEMTLRNDQRLARDILSEHFQGAGEMQTILMKRWHRGDPVIIRSQKQDLVR